MSPSNGGTSVPFCPPTSSAPARRGLPFLTTGALERRRDQLLRAASEPSMARWTSFALAYSFPDFPTADALSLYVVYRLRSVTLASIQAELSDLGYYFRSIDARRWTTARNSAIVELTLEGAANSNPHRRDEAQPLPVENLVKGVEKALQCSTYDDLAWAAMLIVCFLGCARLREVTDYDCAELGDPREHILRDSVTITDQRFWATLPYHNADARITHSTLCFPASDAGPLLDVVRAYLRARDASHGAEGPLWLDSTGAVPTQRFFNVRLKAFCGEPYTGQSIRAGGACYYARRGVSDPIINCFGRWSLEAWEDYVYRFPGVARARHERDAGAARIAVPTLSAKLAARLTMLLR